MDNWTAIATRRNVVHRSARVALLVGTILVLINYIDRIFSGDLELTDYFKIILTYIVPYCVSVYASVRAIQEDEQ